MNPTEFLTRLYGAQLEEGFINIFTIPGQKSAWFSDMEKAGEYAAKQKDKNVYFSLGIFPKDLGPKRKGKAEEAIGFQVLGVDIDIEGPNHKKGGLVKTEEEALELLDYAFPPELVPTLTIHSGGGLQAFWILNEPWIFEDSYEDNNGRYLFARVVKHLQCYASGKEVAIDSTHTLSQVLRVAGTANVKDKDNPREVKVIRDTGELYNPDSFDILMEFAQEKKRIGQPETKSDLALNPNAQPPQDKFNDLLSVDRTFNRAWNKAMDTEIKRQQMKRNAPKIDTSLSVYDMILTNIATTYHWSRQEKANLIIAFRRKHQQKQEDMDKALRSDYIDLTLNQAAVKDDAKDVDEETKAFTKEAVAYQNAKSSGKISKKEIKKKDKEMEENAKREFYKNMGVTISHINKYLSTPPEYELVLGNGQRIMVGKSSNLLNQEKIRQSFFDSCNIHLGTKKQAGWQKITQGFVFLMKEVETVTETRDEDALTSWIREHVEAMGINDDPKEACLAGDPFRKDGRVLVFADRFREFLKIKKDEKINAKELGLRMQTYGPHPKPMGFRLPGNKKINRTVYDVTKALEGEDGGAEETPEKA